MPFNQNLPLSARDQVRLEVGDVDPDNEILPDETYDHLLDKYSDNVRRASLDAARYILFYLTRYTRERTGAIEVYGAEWATNYRKALELFLKDPNINTIRPVPYAGGISHADAEANDANEDNIRPWRGGCLPEENQDLQF